MAQPTTKTQFKEWCLRKLGKPVIEINVDQDQVDDRIEEALQFYYDYHFDGVEKTYVKHQVTNSFIEFAALAEGDFAVGEVIAEYADGTTAADATCGCNCAHACRCNRPDCKQKTILQKAKRWNVFTRSKAMSASPTVSDKTSVLVQLTIADNYLQYIKASYELEYIPCPRKHHRSS